jgi:N6-adenosine-specific RNA methylase IME4
MLGFGSIILLMALLDGLPYQHFRCVHADPPWSFQNWGEPGDRSAENHYQTMSINEIARLPVVAHAAPDCHLFLWVTGPMVTIGAHVPLMKRWGFEPSAMAFVWIKLNPSWHPCWLGHIDDAISFMGLGHTTRQNAELCLLGRRGSPVRLSRSVRQIIMAPVREHSRKPEDVYERIEQYCEGPRLDLFGRCSRAGWVVKGDEATKFDVPQFRRSEQKRNTVK